MISSSKNKLLGGAILTALTVLVIWLVWKFFGLINGASDSIKATSITAIVSVIVFMFGRYFEQRREAKQRINTEKVGVYRRFFDFYFDLVAHDKIHDEPVSHEKVMRDMLDFQKDILFWGTDSVIRAYLDFKDAMIEFDDDKVELPKKLAVVITSVSKVLVAMRRDLGYNFTSLGPSDVARLQLANDEETRKIFEHL